MKTLTTTLILLSFYTGLSFSEEYKKTKEMLYLDEQFCSKLEIKLASNPEKYRPNANKERKQFVGENRLKYGRNDYYLWVDSYDASGDGIDDLIAIDWLQKNKQLFYLAFYVIPKQGNLYHEKTNLKKYLLSKKLYKRHNEGLLPLIPESFNIKLKNGKEIDESFVGYHSIKPIYYENQVYLFAEKENKSGKRRLIFNLNKGLCNIHLSCIF